jgi:hypothetical protein
VTMISFSMPLSPFRSHPRVPHPGGTARATRRAAAAIHQLPFAVPVAAIGRGELPADPGLEYDAGEPGSPRLAR